MRIAHITAPAAFGGLERVVGGLARATAQAGHEVLLVLTLEPGSPVPAWAESLRGENVSVEPLFLPARAYLRERRAVRELLSRARTRVVHTHGYRSDVVHAGVARSAGLALVSTAHGFASTGTRGRIYEWLQVRSWSRFDAVVAVSQPLMATLERAGVPADRLRFIQNGVIAGVAPLMSPEAARARLDLPRGAPVVGWVGRFSEEKDPRLMLRAFARCADKTSVLCMVGDGPMAAECRALAEELEVSDRVSFPGVLPDAAPCFTAFDVLALSSRTEGTPMVVLEAAQAGVPVVGTAVGGVPALLDGRAGWLVPAGDEAALAAALDVVIADRDDATRRAAKLGARLGESTKGEGWVERYLTLYERVQR